jgi:hypothetical protein
MQAVWIVLAVVVAFALTSWKLLHSLIAAMWLMFFVLPYDV